jgi:hypothetical protein
MTTKIQNLTSATRSAMCLAMAALIVTAGLVTGAVGADIAYQSAVTRSASLAAHATTGTTTHTAVG